MTASNNTPAAKADERDWRGPLWDAVDVYVRACRGDPSKYVYGNTARQLAVVEAERAVKDALLRAKLAVLNEVLDEWNAVGGTLWDALEHQRAELQELLTATDSGGGKGTR